MARRLHQFTGSTATGKLVMQFAAQRISRSFAGVRRQVAEHRARRLPGSRSRRQPPQRSPSSQPGRDVLGGLAAAGRSIHQGRDAREDRGRGPHHAARRSARSATRLGAIVDETQMQRCAVVHRRRQTDGARVALGGARTRVEPVVFTCSDGVRRRDADAHRGARRSRAVLGPSRFRTSRRRSRSRTTWDYGLAAAVWTRDITTRIAPRAPCAPVPST